MQTAPDYAALFDASPYPYLLIDKEFTIIGANRAYLQAVGRTDDIVGMPLFDAFPANPDDPDATNVREIAGSIERAIATKQVQHSPFLRYAVPREGADGRVFDERFWSTVHTPVLDAHGEVVYVSQNAIDVTDLYRMTSQGSTGAAEAGGNDPTVGVSRAQMQEAMRRIREADDRLREGMLAARMVVWDMDLVSGAVQFSENVQAVFGGAWNSSAAVWQALHPDDLEKLHLARARAIATCGSYEEYVRLIRPDDQGILWLHVKGVVRCGDNGTPLSIRGISVDVTERMRAEEELRDADRRKDEFLAMLAHELRNPLAPISAAAQILKMTTLKPDMVRRTSEVISRQVGHMTSLVDDLLDVSRVTRGLIALDRKQLGIMDIVTDAVEQVRPLINARRQDLSVRLPPDAIELMGDQKRLVQVLTNLLNNAAKYTPEGGQLELTVTATSVAVVIDIRDDGMGIPSELLPHVFDLFTQAERTPDRSQGGLGLGLALVRSLVALHGGSVAAHSQGKGCGSTFSVHLPRIVEAADGNNTVLRIAPAQRRDKGLRLLVVDDNTDAAEMLGAFMESAGHQVSIEYEPYQAIERARLEQPDVCLLDIGLPGMDGNQLARCLRLMPQMSHTTLIAVTGYGKEFDRDTSIAAGFDYYFVKPADPLALVALLDRIQVS